MLKISKSELEKEYINNNLSLKEMSLYFNCSESHIRRQLKKYKIKKSKELIKEKVKKTNLERYGVENPAKAEKIKEKSKQTCLKKYEVEYSLQAKEIKEKAKKTNLEKYGHINIAQGIKKEQIRKTHLERYGVEYAQQNKNIQEKTKKTNLERYGVEYLTQSKEIREKIENICLEKYGTKNVLALNSAKGKFREKIKQTNLEKYGNEVASKSEIVKENARKNNLEKYGVENVYQLNWVKQKCHESRKRNKTINTSKPEKRILEKLLFKYHDTIYQYRSEKYPWACDFYIPELDLYIEYQGHWGHGKEPYDPNNLEHLKLIEKWTNKNTDYYKRCVKGWTINDVNKRKWASQNNLNWLEFFKEEDFYKWLETK